MVKLKWKCTWKSQKYPQVSTAHRTDIVESRQDRATGKNVLYGFLEILDSSSRRPSIGLSSQ